ncbi:MAG: DUF1924 domain-containing protein [Deltaproteobacteria bacterium]|nr:DUF1924 domain-containing protein [Deltaproteobacteria bacterium]
MRRKISYLLALAVSITAIGTGSADAATKLNPQMQALVDSYQKEAGVKAFSADEGKKLFMSKRMHSVKKEERSCTTCHTTNPAQTGKTVVGKPIDPISPAVTKDRFTDPKKVEKWFKRNCEWVLERECTPKEKGDYITFMTSL